MLCFKLSKEIILDAGSDMLTNDVGVDIGRLDAVLVVECARIPCTNTGDLYQVYHLIYL